ncbi:exonuclease SbcCD subunit D [Jeotgalibacillus haloalkalitolerans]|uniref:Nuclease SbcCD subunit D n=1 Tax=Jeotgalibacillus haloalkalitolerans TaxID=3104292 RepID=A0ABU5KKQ2_9BACL|nr:exonuclease SbcCD subunit D [Jeotgalibacillus sp. HH7-29]MDZ5711831.1 exonuclease SbcCD subunit D [Jeotgalibacillus sp. HH7-29]
MKFLHTADWHLGKLIHGVYMTEDQSEILEQFVELADRIKPDAIIIAGDLYDRSVPPAEAVNLLNETLYKLNVDMKIPVVAISGNHDSADRIAFGSAWYKHSDLHVTGKWSPVLKGVEIKGVRFHSVPYAEPSVIRETLKDDSITSHHDAMKQVVASISSLEDFGEKPEVLVGHSFVTGGSTTDSERTLSVGGAGTVGKELFDSFTYTALGHLHSPYAIRDEKVHYSGSLMKYSFSEANHKKMVKCVTIENQEVSVEEILLKPKRDMVILRGSLEELMKQDFYDRKEDYIKAVLTDEGALIDPINRLRSVYPNVLHLERESTERDKKRDRQVREKHENLSDTELFRRFFAYVTEAEWTEELEAELKESLNVSLKGSDES